MKEIKTLNQINSNHNHMHWVISHLKLEFHLYELDPIGFFISKCIADFLIRTLVFMETIFRSLLHFHLRRAVLCWLWNGNKRMLDLWCSRGKFRIRMKIWERHWMKTSFLHKRLEQLHKLYEAHIWVSLNTWLCIILMLFICNSLLLLQQEREYLTTNSLQTSAFVKLDIMLLFYTMSQGVWLIALT